MNDLDNIGAICDECARKLGFVPKNKVAGMWIGNCDNCLQYGPCTDLWHDWERKENKNEDA